MWLPRRSQKTLPRREWSKISFTKPKVPRRRFLKTSFKKEKSNQKKCVWHGPCVGIMCFIQKGQNVLIVFWSYDLSLYVLWARHLCVLTRPVSARVGEFSRVQRNVCLYCQIKFKVKIWVFNVEMWCKVGSCEFQQVMFIVWLIVCIFFSVI